MAHSSITFRGNHQLFTDSVISLLMDLTMKEWRSVVLKDDSFMALHPLFEWWSSLASHLGPGYIELKLEKNISTDSSLIKLKQILRILKKNLTRCGEHVSKNELNSVRCRGGLFTSDMRTTVVVDSIHKLRALLGY